MLSRRRTQIGPAAAVVAVWLACITAADRLTGGEPMAAAPPPRNTGPEAVARSRVRRHGRATVRVIRRSPAVMREDAARVSRGDLFSTWSNRYLE